MNPLPLRWVHNWTPGEPNTLQYFRPADIGDAVTDENWPGSYGTPYKFCYENCMWGEWLDVPTAEV